MAKLTVYSLLIIVPVKSHKDRESVNRKLLGMFGQRHIRHDTCLATDVRMHVKVGSQSGRPESEVIEIVRDALVKLFPGRNVRVYG